MQERRTLFLYLSKDEIPSSATEVTSSNYTSVTGNVLYVPVFIGDQSNAKLQVTFNGVGLNGKLEVFRTFFINNDVPSEYLVNSYGSYLTYCNCYVKFYYHDTYYAVPLQPIALYDTETNDMPYPGSTRMAYTIPFIKTEDNLIGSYITSGTGRLVGYVPIKLALSRSENNKQYADVYKDILITAFTLLNTSYALYIDTE